MSYICNLADTFSKMPVFLLTEELMDQKAEYLQMEEIFIVRSDSTTIPSVIEHTERIPYLEKNPRIYTQDSIFVDTKSHDHAEVFFSSPVSWSDGGAGVLIGVRTNDLLQQMIEEVDFEDQGMSCIVDSKGNVIVSATDMKPFRNLYTIFKEGSDKEDAGIQRMREDIAARRSGVIQFQDIGGEPMMLGYDFLGINDWLLLTLLPPDLFTQGSGKYMLYYVLIAGFLTLGLFLILTYIIYSPRHSLKKIRTVALTDDITGGMNKTAFQMEGERQIRAHPSQVYTVVYLNIRNFKRFNERFGVKDGVEILRKTYLTLQDCLRAGELLSRTSDDHFFLLLKCGGEETLSRLDEMPDQLEMHLSERFSIDRSSLASGRLSHKKARDRFYDAA